MTLEKIGLMPIETETIKAAFNDIENGSLTIKDLHFTWDMTGKMSGNACTGSCSLCNPYCKMYSNDPEKVCSKCYANAMHANKGKYKSFNRHYEINTAILTCKVWPVNDMPYINRQIFRLESFGDIMNGIQVVNYFNLCKKNPGCGFTIWTKNPGIIQKVVNLGYKIPKNLRIIVSSHYLNRVVDISRFTFKIYAVFTVYTCDHAISNNIRINCGGYKCMSCMRCYGHGNKAKTIYINEMLKSQQKRYSKLTGIIFN